MDKILQSSLVSSSVVAFLIFVMSLLVLAVASINIFGIQLGKIMRWVWPLCLLRKFGVLGGSCTTNTGLGTLYATWGVGITLVLIFFFPEVLNMIPGLGGLEAIVPAVLIALVVVFVVGWLMDESVQRSWVGSSYINNMSSVKVAHWLCFLASFTVPIYTLVKAYFF
jgi:hypothetical protein